MPWLKFMWLLFGEPATVASFDTYAHSRSQTKIKRLRATRDPPRIVSRTILFYYCVRFIGAFGYEQTNDIIPLVDVAVVIGMARYDCARWVQPKQRRSKIERGNHINSITYDRSAPLERNTALLIIITIVNMHWSGDDGAVERSVAKEN